MEINLSLIQKKINITFKNSDLLLEVFIHSSFKHENPEIHVNHNERLEFLGDSILNMIVTEYLFFSFPQKSEGSLSKLRSLLVNCEMCSNYINILEIGNFLLLGKGEKKNYERGKISTQGNLFEALVGAIFIDQGLEIAKQFILNLLPNINTLASLNTIHNKNKLQDYYQKKYGSHPTYELVNTDEKNKEKIFHIQVKFKNNIIGNGYGKSKKEAENQAAINALKKIENL